MIRRGIGVQSFVSAGVPTDADAQAFITAAGITDATQQSAINTLVTDLKGYGIWSKMKAIWPFVGGTSSSHKWNLRDPRDLNAAFRLVFSGGWTHSSTGAKPNGTNGYGDTFLTPATSISQNSAHLSFYSRTQSIGDGFNIGSVKTNPPFEGLHIAISFGLNSNQMRTRCNSQNPSTSYTPTDTRGLFSISRIASSQFKGYRNNTSVFTAAETSNSPNNVKIVIGATNTTGGVSDYSTNECAFASIGDGLTDTEAANLYTAVQAYQTSLNRNV
jgi:hypothetical protein